MKRKLSAILALTLSLALVLSACGGDNGSSTTEDGEKVLKVAVGASLTGTAAKAGTAFDEATKMAFEDIDYTIGDYTIELITVDLTDDPEKGALALEQAIVRDGAQVAMQGWLTTVAMSTMDTAARYQIPYMFNYGAGEALDEKWAEDPEYYSYYIGKMFPTNDFIAQAYADLMDYGFETGEITGDKTIAIYGEDTDWGHSLGDLLEKYFGEAGYEIVYDEYFAAGTTDFYAILSKIQQSGATVVAGTINTPATAAAFLKQAQEIGLDAQMICHSLNENADWYELCGDSAEGVFDMLPGYTDERGAEFEARWLERMGYSASISCESVAYDCALCFIEMLQDCYDMYGVLDSETIYQFGCEQVQTGQWVYDDSILQACYQWEEGRLSPVVGEDAFYNPLGQVHNGEFVTVWPSSRAVEDPVF